MNTKTRLGLATAVLAVAAGLAAPAQAGNDPIIKTGTCSGSAEWKLKAKHDDSRIEVEFEVDSNRAGQSWRVRLRDNGAVVFRGTRVTRRPSGSFSVDRRIADRAGTDTIRARASHNGQVCTASLEI